MKRKQKPALIVASVPGFDPNRPDLQEFLNSLAAQALGEDPTAPRRARARKKAGITRRAPRSTPKRRG